MQTLRGMLETRVISNLDPYGLEEQLPSINVLWSTVPTRAEIELQRIAEEDRRGGQALVILNTSEGGMNLLPSNPRGWKLDDIMRKWEVYEDTAGHTHDVYFAINFFPDQSLDRIILIGHGILPEREGQAAAGVNYDNSAFNLEQLVVWLGLADNVRRVLKPGGRLVLASCSNYPSDVSDIADFIGVTVEAGDGFVQYIDHDWWPFTVVARPGETPVQIAHPSIYLDENLNYRVRRPK